MTEGGQGYGLAGEPAAETTADETVFVEDPTTTADPRVDDAVARLAELRDLPTADHVSVYEDIHSRLNEALADLGDPATPNQPYLGNG